MKQRGLALQTVMKSCLNNDMAIYKGLRNCVCKELRNAKAEYYISVITEGRGNCSAMWKQINSLIKPLGKSITRICELKIGNQSSSDSKLLMYSITFLFPLSRNSPITLKFTIWSYLTQIMYLIMSLHYSKQISNY